MSSASDNVEREERLRKKRLTDARTARVREIADGVKLALQELGLAPGSKKP